MQNEILRPVLETDEVAVPRYDVVGANGQVLQQNVELRLKNEVVQEGTPYDEESVLPNALVQQLGLPASATPADAFAAVIAKSGAKVSMNEPTAQDSVEAGYSIGALWLRTYFSIVNRAYDASASGFTTVACSFAKSGQVFTVTGNGDDKIISVSGTMLADGWLYAVITPEATAASVRLVQGDKTVQLAVGERNVVCIDYMGADFLIEATYDTANIASGSSIVIENLTIMSKHSVYSSNIDANSDVTVDSLLSICNREAPFDEIMLPVKVFQHVSDGVWELIYGLTDVVRDLLNLECDATLEDSLVKLHEELHEEADTLLGMITALPTVYRLPAASGFSNSAYYCKVSGMVYIWGTLTKSVPRQLDANTVLATLPVGFRPQTNYTIGANVTTGAGGTGMQPRSYFSVNTAGEVILPYSCYKNDGFSFGIDFSAMFPVGG